MKKILILIITLTLLPQAILSEERKAIKKTGILKVTNVARASTDALLESGKLNPRDYYPKEDLVAGAEYLARVKNPFQFDIKPYIKTGFPVFPMFDYMKNAGMDLFSGSINIAAGIHFKNFLNGGKDGSTFQIEAFHSRFESGAGSGLSAISNGILVGTTRLQISGVTTQYNIYPGSLDFLYFGIGGGISLHNFQVEYLKRDIYVNNAKQTLKNTSETSLAPLVQFTIGVDLPIYENIRGLMNTDYQVFFFKDKIGAVLSFSLGVATLIDF